LRGGGKRWWRSHEYAQTARSHNTMSAIAYNFKCSLCGKEFEAPEIPEMSYGVFVMRTQESGEAAFLDALNDSVFLETYELVKRHPRIASLPEAERGRIQQAVFPVACDKTVRGESLQIGLQPKCPSCGSRNMESWQQVMPSRLWLLPLVRHDSWNAKTVAEKTAAINYGVQELIQGRSPS